MFDDYAKKRKGKGVTLKEVKVDFLGLSGTWVADEAQQSAAWEMYVELVTRIAVQPLKSDHGLVREALTSLYSLFGETRRILKAYGPGVAIPVTKGAISFGAIAVDVLNHALREFLAEWHRRLQEHESTRSTSVSAAEHERSWAHEKELREKLDEKRLVLTAYADLLAESIGIEKLH